MRKPTLPLLAVVLSTACGPGPVSEERVPPLNDAQRDALNQELANTNSREAMANLTHFAPLCDANGYPLVGNLVTKTSDITASQLCAAIRDHK